MLIKKNDLVEVITGDNRSRKNRRTIAKVLRVITETNKVVVEGVNKVYKHIKPNQRNPRGGRLSKEMPIHVSNVLLLNPDLGRGVRVGVKITESGDKIRVCRKTGKELGVIRRSKSKKGVK